MAGPYDPTDATTLSTMYPGIDPQSRGQTDINEINKYHGWTLDDIAAWRQRYPLQNNTGTTGTTGGGGTGNDYHFMPGPAPAFNAPAFQSPQAPVPEWQPAPTYQGPADFSYGAFTAPGATGMYADPGYQYRMQQGQQALDQSAAARGTLRGGAQLQALMKYGQDQGSQEYQNVWNRAAQAYGMNYGVARDVYDRAAQAAGDTYKRGLDERNAKYNYQTDTWGRDRAERLSAYDAAFANKKAEYAPAYDTWAAQNLAGAANANRDWERYQFGVNDEFRRWSANLDQAYRDKAYAGDDSYRYAVLDENRRQFLASLGLQATA